MAIGFNLVILLAAGVVTTVGAPDITRDAPDPRRRCHHPGGGAPGHHRDVQPGHGSQCPEPGREQGPRAGHDRGRPSPGVRDPRRQRSRDGGERVGGAVGRRPGSQGHRRRRPGGDPLATASTPTSGRALVAGSDPTVRDARCSRPPSASPPTGDRPRSSPTARRSTPAPSQRPRYGRCSAVCVPVSIMGRTTGVVHWAGPTPALLHPPVVNQLEVLANQTGARIGMIRVVSDSQLQA